MRKKYYYILTVPIFCILFSLTVNATTSYNSVNISIQNSNNGMLLATTYPSLDGILLDAEDIQGTSQSYWKFEPNFALDLTNLPSGFISGYLLFDITITSGLTNGAYSNWSVSNLANGDGMYSAITWARNNVFRVLVMLDNYNTLSGNAHIGDLCLTYMDKSTAYSATNATSFTNSISLVTNTLEKSDTVVNDRLTALIYSAVTQADGPFLSSIEQWTNYIYNQVTQTNANLGTIIRDLEDYITFMNTYIPNLSSINTNTANIYTQLQTIYMYLKDRAVLQTTTNKSRIRYIDGNYVFSNDNGQRSILISKDKNIEYVYINGFATNNGNIFYFEQDPTTTSGAIVYPTRVIKLSAGEQYYPIDFKYNENFVFFNLGASGYGDTIFKAYIGDGYTYSAIMYYIESMMNMNNEQSSVAAEIESQYADRESQSSQLINGMGSLIMPSISSGDLDIMGSVDPTQKINFFGLIALITHNQIVTKIMLIIVLGAIVGYILYGKK